MKKASISRVQPPAYNTYDPVQSGLPMGSQMLHTMPAPRLTRPQVYSEPTAWIFSTLLRILTPAR